MNYKVVQGSLSSETCPENLMVAPKQCPNQIAELPQLTLINVEKQLPSSKGEPSHAMAIDLYPGSCSYSHDLLYML